MDIYKNCSLIALMEKERSHSGKYCGIVVTNTSSMIYGIQGEILKSRIDSEYGTDAVEKQSGFRAG